jgi:hypothetical protein
MKSILLLALTSWLAASSVIAGDFPFGAVTREELMMTTYDKDPDAAAVVLNEFGRAYFVAEDLSITLEYHVRIKILKKEALSLSDFSIPLYRYANTGKIDYITRLKASSFVLGPDGNIVETKLSTKDVMTEKYESGEVKKFAIPNVVEGTVIEVYYEFHTPYIFNFHEWKFQREIPKIHSEYWTLIPGYYRYHVSLIGFLKLSKNESEVVEGCFPRGVGCVSQKFAMDDIPAFVEEDFMTTKSNFVSAIRFELSEVHHPNGYVDKISREWDDVAEELRQDSRFGAQLRRGDDILDRTLTQSIKAEPDKLTRAKRAYEHIVKHYTWNGHINKYCELGLRKAYPSQTGNVADVNLSLVSALRSVGLDADPVILSTRDNGYVTELFPVLSEFNYVIARVVIDGQAHLLDATDPLLPFGMLPFQCLNLKGRVIGEKETSWQDITTPGSFRQNNYIELSFSEDGTLKGTVRNTYLGYDALNSRRRIESFDSQEEYRESLQKGFREATITNLEIQNLEDVEKPLIEKMSVEMPAFSEDDSQFLLNPFLVNRTVRNPFRSQERLYPVDFGATMDERITIVLTFPEGVRLENLPEEVGLMLPGGGGHYVLKALKEGRRVSILSWLTTKKPLYNHEEYFYLRELFARIVQVQNTDLIFVKD